MNAPNSRVQVLEGGNCYGINAANGYEAKRLHRILQVNGVHASKPTRLEGTSTWLIRIPAGRKLPYIKLRALLDEVCAGPLY